MFNAARVSASAAKARIPMSATAIASATRMDPLPWLRSSVGGRQARHKAEVRASSANKNGDRTWIRSPQCLKGDEDDRRRLGRARDLLLRTGDAVDRDAARLQRF